ncbi:MAG: ABC transporter permease [Pseudomonadota bacterium]
MIKVRHQLKKFASIHTIDLSGMTKLDTAGAMLLHQWVQKNIALENLQSPYRELYELFESAQPTAKQKPARSRFSMAAPIIRTGKGTLNALRTARELIVFLGQATVSLVKTFARPRRLRFGEVTHHIEQIGINAMPIIALIAFLISIVLAYQSAEQLRPLGAQRFTINLITISVLREMGVLLTAIMVAGRSGSAFTAEIGVMKIREEVDALKAIGIDPFELLVIPRVIAIVIALPLLAFLANMMGLLGGALLSKLLIGIDFGQYVDQVQIIAANGNALFVGMVKAPVFAFFIGLVACMHGMKVAGSAESVGIETTASVVHSIFLVLVIDALFSIFFQQVGI